MDIVDKAWILQRRIEKRFKMVGKGKYGRVLKLARKPTSEEYNKITLITGVGILIVGALGFFIWIGWEKFTEMLYGIIGGLLL